MTSRLHIVVDEAEKERFRRAAEREGISLSEWLRRAARRRLRSANRRPRLDTAEELEAFFRACDARESEAEPDWSEHRKVIEASRDPGAPGS